MEDIIIPEDWRPSDSMIKVIGVGGGGCNAVSYMYNQKIEGCTFYVCNSDKQALDKCPVPEKIPIGTLGAGTDPTAGRNCAIENQKLIAEKLLGDETKMLFITAGMGGGTGTGASPVIAKMAKDAGILTVAVVTLPFKDEKNGSYGKAIDGIHELENIVDSLLVIDNQKIIDTYPDVLIHQAFPKTDEVLATAVKSIVDIIKTEGHINMDFKDINNMMRHSGYALMGSGVGSGPDRIKQAVENAMACPLLLAFDPKTTQNALINITVGLNEQSIVAGDLTRINEEVGKYLGNANTFKRGIVYEEDPAFGDKVQVTIIATGIKMSLLEGAIDFSEGSIIYIDDQYTYQPPQAGEEIVLGDGRSDKVGRGSGNRKFWFTDKPDLCIGYSEASEPFEKETAYRRAMRKLAKED